MNIIDGDLAMFASRLDRYGMDNKLYFPIVTLYRPHFISNNESWKVFEDDDIVLYFIKDEVQETSRVINLEQNKYPKGLIPLEDTFSPNDASKVEISKNFFSKKIDDDEQVNIGTKIEPQILNLLISCSPHEKDFLFKTFS